MTRFLRTILVVISMAAIWSVMWGQQANQEPATTEERLAQAEERLAVLEKALAASPELAGRLPQSALETRLARLEARVEKLEAQSLREPVAAPSSGYDRMLESRVRALERQVARIR